jgi:hypothetical protein
VALQLRPVADKSVGDGESIRRMNVLARTYGIPKEDVKGRRSYGCISIHTISQKLILMSVLPAELSRMNAVK